MKKRSAVSAGVTVFLILCALFTLAPLLLALVNSFKSNGEILTNVLSLPKEINFENYVRSFGKMHYLRSLGNTAFLAAGGVGLIILFSSLAGWKLCRTKTRLSGFLLSLFIFSMLIPFS